MSTPIQTSGFDWLPPPLLASIRDRFRPIQEVDALETSFPAAASPEFFDLLREIVREAGQQTPPETLAAPFSVEAAASLQQLLQDHDKPLAPARADKTISTPLFGTIWTTCCHSSLKGLHEGLEAEMPTVVLVDLLADPDEAEKLQVAPVSLSIEYAGGDDLVLPSGACHPAMMVEIWNEQPCLRTQLYRCAGVLSEEEREWLYALVLASRGGPVATSVSPAYRGTPICSLDDPRLIFREWELLRTALVRVPALMGSKETHTPLRFPTQWARARSELPLSMAAQGTRAEQFSALFRIRDLDLFLRATYVSESDRIVIRILDAAGEPSCLLDGARLMVHDAPPGIAIAEGAAELPGESLQASIQVRSVEGRLLGIEPCRG